MPIPCVMQCIGTSSGESKKRALSARVGSVSVFTRVSEASEEPGSLKPMWPGASDAEDLQVDPAGRRDRRLVVGAGVLDRRRVAVRHAHELGREARAARTTSRVITAR